MIRAYLRLVFWGQSVENDLDRRVPPCNVGSPGLKVLHGTVDDIDYP